MTNPKSHYEGTVKVPKKQLTFMLLNNPTRIKDFAIQEGYVTCERDRLLAVKYARHVLNVLKDNFEKLKIEEDTAKKIDTIESFMKGLENG